MSQSPDQSVDPGPEIRAFLHLAADMPRDYPTILAALRETPPEWQCEMLAMTVDMLYNLAYVRRYCRNEGQ